jgi:hypothetical protein
MLRRKKGPPRAGGPKKRDHKEVERGSLPDRITVSSELESNLSLPRQGRRTTLQLAFASHRLAPRRNETLTNPAQPAAMSFDLASAAAATGVAKSSVLRAIKAGRISATRDDNGRWHVEPVELFKIFPPLPPTQPTTHQHGAPDRVTQLLEDQVAELRIMLANMRQREADLQRDRDHWRTAFENTQRLLPAPAHQDAAGAQPTQPTQPGGSNDPPVAENPSKDDPPAPSRLRRAWRWMRATG